MSATHGLGVYGDAVGVTTPLDHKMAQIGFFAKTAANVIRPGLFWDGSTTIVSGKANMSYDVRAFAAVTTRGATAGAIPLANDGVTNVATTAAPGSNSRYDVIYIWQREFSLDGSNSDPVIGVVQGSAAASPTVPSLAAFPGAIELARVLVPSGVTATNSGTTITQKAPFTAAAGGTIPFRSSTERDEGTYIEGQLGWLIDTNTLQQYDGSAWANVTPSVGLVPITPTSVSGSGVTASGNVVTLAAATSASINGIFTSAYRNYLISFDLTTSGAGGIACTLRLSGSDASTAYDRTRLSGVGATASSAQSLNQASWETVAAAIAGRHASEIRLWAPGVAVATVGQIDTTSTDNPMTAAAGVVKAAIQHRTATAYDGITITPGAAATGTVRIWAFN